MKNSLQNKKKIFILIQKEVVNVVGGAITVFINFCNLLCQNGYEVHGICHNSIIGKPTGLDSNVIFINLYQKYDGLDYFRSINKYIKENSPNLLIFFFPFLYADAHLKKDFDNIPRILMFHSRPDVYFINSGEKEKLKPQYKNTISQVLFESQINLLPDFIKSSKILVIPNSIIPAKKIINTDIEHKKIVYLSRVDPYKGIEFLMHSFKKISKKYKNWSLDIYGHICNEEYYNKLQTLRAKLNLERQIKFKGITSTPTSTMLDYDFCVFPSYIEGFSIGLIEAQSVGLPAIGLKGCTGVSDFITNDYNGFLTNKSHRDFANKIEKMIKNKDLRKIMSQNAVNIASKYSKNIVDNTWLNVIDKILNGKEDKLEFFDIKKLKPSKYKFFKLHDIMKLGQPPKTFSLKKTFIKIRNIARKRLTMLLKLN